MKKIIILTLLFLTSNFTFAQYKHDSIKVDFGYLHYYVKGKGTPIVHLQGGPGFSHFYMRKIADSITNHQNILIDYQGTGKSQYRNADASWVSIDRIIADVELVRKKMNIEKWTVIGHSYGGMFAFYYGVKHPNQVNKIISICGAGTDNSFQNYFMDNIEVRFSEEDKKMINNLMANESIPFQERMAKVLYFQTKIGYFYDRNKADIFFQSLASENMNTLYNDAFFNAYVSNPNFFKFDIYKEFIKTKIPIRFIEGRQDPGNDGKSILLNEKLKNSKIQFIEKSGHFIWIEKPETFFKVLSSFLTN